MSIYRCNTFELKPMPYGNCCGGDNRAFEFFGLKGLSGCCSGLSGWLSGGWTYPSWDSNFGYMNFGHCNSYNCGNSSWNWSPLKTTLAFAGGLAVTLGIGALVSNLCKKEYIPSILRTEVPTKAPEVVTPKSDEVAEDNTVKETPQEAVTRILKEKGVEADETLIKAVAQKYPTMKDISSAGLTIEDRVANYAKGLMYQDVVNEHVNARLNKTSIDKKYVIGNLENAKSNEEFKNIYIQFAQEQIELYESEKGQDNKIDAVEYLAKEFLDAGINPEDLSDEQMAECKKKVEIMFQMLDINKNSKLDKEEMACLSWTMATIRTDKDTPNNTNHDITFGEYNNFTEVIEIYQSAVSSLSKEAREKFDSYMQTNNSMIALTILKENCELAKDELDAIVRVFQVYNEQNVRQFANKTN